jgi:hypothetical protein
MSTEPTEPQTVWERPVDQVASGMRVGVRGAVFSIGGSERSAVTISISVPDAFMETTESGTSATILLNPDEAQGLASWLREAAATALGAAPPMYE